MRHRLKWFIHLRAQRPKEGRWAPLRGYTPLKSMAPVPFTAFIYLTIVRMNYTLFNFLGFGVFRLVRTWFDGTWHEKFDKSSAVAEMGDRGHNRHRPKRGGAAVPLSWGELGPHLTQCRLGRVYQVASSSIQPFGHNRHGPKTGGYAPFRGELRPHLTQRRLGRHLSPYQVASWSIQPFGHNRHGPRIGWGLCPFFWGSWVLIEHIKSPGTRPTSIPSGILVHPAVWLQRSDSIRRTVLQTVAQKPLV